MKIKKNLLKIEIFEDLDKGDTFRVVEDGEVDNPVFMKVWSSEEDKTYNAVDLASGQLFVMHSQKETVWIDYALQEV